MSKLTQAMPKPMANEKTPHKVLIIDDSKADRRIYRRSLEQDISRNYSLYEAAYAEQGIDLCQRERFDVILLDFQLPDMDGLHLLAEVQTHQPQAGVIMLTGHGSEQIAVQALKSGVQDYLIKERLPQTVLQRAVQTVINQKQLQSNQQQHKVITQLALNIRRSLVLEETLRTTVEEVRQLLMCDRVLAYQFEPDMSGRIIAESVAEGYRPALGETIRDSYFQEQGVAEYCQGRIQHVNNIYTANLDPCHIELLEQFNVKAILVTPILLEHGNSETPQLWGLLVAHHCQSQRGWRAEEVKLLEALSLHIAIAIQQAQLLETTKAALEKAQSLSAFRSKVLTTISHEYNTPLAAIRTAVETLNVHAASLTANDRERCLSIIESKAKHLSGLVQEMLMANRAELDQLQLKPVALNLETFLSKLIAEYRDAGANRHNISLSSFGNLENFSGDPGLLQQVFDNLLSNAIKYSPDGGDIHLVLMGDLTHVTCQINDEGIGISEEDIPYIFHMFRRGKNVGTTPGTGLGLNIAKVAVELHGGTIVVKSKPGRGTRIRVELPKQHE